MQSAEARTESKVSFFMAVADVVAYGMEESLLHIRRLLETSEKLCPDIRRGAVLGIRRDALWLGDFLLTTSEEMCCW